MEPNEIHQIQYNINLIIFWVVFSCSWGVDNFGCEFFSFGSYTHRIPLTIFSLFFSIFLHSVLVMGFMILIKIKAVGIICVHVKKARWWGWEPLQMWLWLWEQRLWLASDSGWVRQLTIRAVINYDAVFTAAVTLYCGCCNWNWNNGQQRVSQILL